jgi:hypothetical protein
MVQDSSTTTLQATTVQATTGDEEQLQTLRHQDALDNKTILKSRKYMCHQILDIFEHAFSISGDHGAG